MGEYVGFDVSKEATAFCVMDEDGKVLARGKVASDPVALFEALREQCLCPERIVLETGTLSFLAGARAAHGPCRWRSSTRGPGARGDEVAAQQDGRGRRRASGGDRAHGLLPRRSGQERGGAGGADPAQGARSPGTSAARYGERDTGSSGVLGASHSQGGAQAGGDPALLADHRRAIPLAGKERRRDGVNEPGGDDGGSAR